MRKLNVRIGENGKIENLTSHDNGETWITQDGEVLRHHEVYDEPKFDIVAAGILATLGLLIAACLFVMWIGN